jgi:hypothetical protein
MYHYLLPMSELRNVKVFPRRFFLENYSFTISFQTSAKVQTPLSVSVPRSLEAFASSSLLPTSEGRAY